MKHNIKITIILLCMFIITQLIGLAVINAYIPKHETIIVNGTEQNITINPLPYGMQPPEDIEPKFSLISIIIAFAIAIGLIFLLTKIRSELFLRLWFFVVVIIALGITLNSLFFAVKIPFSVILATLIALPLAFFKIFKRNMLIHNLTELMIYPGIATIFVPLLNVWTIIFLLILISAYDIWAVWHTGFMQKMAKYQMEKLKLFAGFFVPYADKKTKQKIKILRQKYKSKKIPAKELKNKKIKVSLAILGGGDVIFPIIAAGIFLRAFGIIPALFITAGSTLALLALFIAAKKGKFYPAMPFISAGIFIGMIASLLVI